MNYLTHPNLLVQFWAAVNQEFDKILDSFIRCDGWLFQDLGVVAKKANIGSVFQCVAATVTSGKGRDERLDHFIRVNYAILDAAKTQWLAPWRTRAVDLSKGDIHPGVKRQVGGFFLLYLLYKGQPVPNRFRRKQAVSMDSRDLLAMHVFNATMQRLPKSDDQFKELGRQLVVMFNELVKSGAFEFSAYGDEFITPSRSIRNLLSAKFCNFTRTIYSLKDIRDQLYYITYKESPKTFHSLVEYGQQLTPNREGVKNDEDKKGNVQEFRPFDKKWTLDEIRALKEENDIGKIAHSIPSILKTLDFGPVLTKERLTGVSDKLLDKEMDNCVQSYKDQTALQTRLKEKHKKETKERHSKVGFVKDCHTTVWKDYLNGNYNWVDEIFKKGGQGASATPAHDQMETELNERSSFLTGHNVADNNDENFRVIDLEDEDDGEWQTDDDDEGNDGNESEADEVLFKKPMNVPNARRSHKKQKSDALSMPTIL